MGNRLHLTVSPTETQYPDIRVPYTEKFTLSHFSLSMGYYHHEVVQAGPSPVLFVPLIHAWWYVYHCYDTSGSFKLTDSDFTAKCSSNATETCSASRHGYVAPFDLKDLTTNLHCISIWINMRKVSFYICPMYHYRTVHCLSLPSLLVYSHSGVLLNPWDLE